MRSACCRPQTLRSPRRGRGFTLIEVLIAIAVVGILTAIALPQYTLYVQRSRVVEAHATLNDIRTRMEQFFQDTRQYNVGAACGVGMPPDGSFTYACAPVNDPALSYAVTATGLGSMAPFSYDITVDPQPAGVGVRRRTLGVHNNWLPVPVANCWQTRPGGHC